MVRKWFEDGAVEKERRYSPGPREMEGMGEPSSRESVSGKIPGNVPWKWWCARVNERVFQ